jgi:hypothetical protein
MTFGEAASAVPTFALEAQMTHNLNHREQPVQKAGQKAGAALPPSPNPSCVRRERTTLASREGTTSVHPELRRVVPYALGNRRALAPEATGAKRVAGGETMSQKTSTAALDSFRFGPLRLQRRAPRQETPNVGPAFRGGPFHHDGGFQNLSMTSRREISNLFFRRTS